MLHKMFDRRNWFRPLRFGFGARPNTIEGWLLCGLYMAFLSGMRLARLRAPDLDHTAWWSAIAAVSVLFLLVCWHKTEGGWRWRWGGE